MQAASRHLSLISDARSPFCCVIADTGAVAGGVAAWQILGGAVEGLDSCSILVLLFLDPEAHARRQLEQHTPKHSRNAVALHAVRSQQDRQGSLAQHITQIITSRASDGRDPLLTFILIDSLDAAVIRCGAPEVLAALRDIGRQKRVKGIVAHTHGPAQAPQTLAALRGCATCTVVLKPAKALQCEVIQKATGRKVHLEAIASTLRNSGATCVHWSCVRMALEA